MEPQQYNNFQAPYGQSSPQDQRFKKLLMVAVIIGVLGIVLFGASLIFSGDDTRELQAKSLAYHQEELRITELADGFNSEEVRFNRFIATSKSLVTSDQVSLQIIYGDELNEKILATITDTDAESRFEEANQVNNLDEELKQTLTKVINQHLVILRSLNNSESNELKQASQIAIANREQLLSQLEKL